VDPAQRNVGLVYPASVHKNVEGTERHPLQEDVRRLVFKLTAVIDLEHVGVVDTGGEADLSLKSVHKHLALEARRSGADFYGDLALKL